MKSQMFQEAICDIDNDLIEAADVRVMPMKKKSILKIASGFAAACLVAVCAIVAVPQIITQTSQTSEPDAKAGGIDGKITIQKEIQVEGNQYEFSNEEGYAYLETVSETIKSELTAMGVDVADFTITKSGYSRVKSGNAGNNIVVNWKDYIAYSGDDIIAIITVLKDEEGFHYYEAWGALWFEDYGRFLSEHAGEELVYIQAGDVDAVLTPDGQIWCASNIDEAIDSADQAKYYSFFKMKQNTYIPE